MQSLRACVLGVVVAGGLSVALFACGGAPAPAETAGTTPTAEPTPTEPAPTATADATPAEPAPTSEPAKETPPAAPAWKSMSHDQQIEHMKTVVVPKMAALFKEFDAKKYGEVGCSTCHGAAAKEGKFEMPNPKLPKLDRTGGFAKHMKKHEKITKWMMEKVVPTMAGTLGAEPFNPETKQGFGCGGCHLVEGK